MLLFYFLRFILESPTFGLVSYKCLSLEESVLRGKSSTEKFCFDVRAAALFSQRTLFKSSSIVSRGKGFVAAANGTRATHCWMRSSSRSWRSPVHSSAAECRLLNCLVVCLLCRSFMSKRLWLQSVVPID